MEFLGLDLDDKTYIIYCCRLFLAVIGITLNAMNIAVLCLAPGKLTPVCKFVINLAVADVSVCLCDIWSIILVVIYGNHLSSAAFCAISVYTFLQMASFLATLLAVVTIATHSYVMVLKPLEHGALFTGRFVSRSVITMWFISVVLSGLAVVLPGIVQDTVSLKKNFDLSDDNIATIRVNHSSNFNNIHMSTLTGTVSNISENASFSEQENHALLEVHSNFATRSMRKAKMEAFRAASRVTYGNITRTARRLDVNVDDLIQYLNETELTLCDKTYFNFVFDPFLIFTLGTFLCVIIMIFVYCRICCEMRQYSRRSYSMAGQKVSRRRSSVTSFLIVFSFIICWIPCSVNFLLIFFNDSVRTENSVVYRNTVFIFQLLNTVVDPLLYALRLPEVRKAYRGLMLRRCWTKNLSRLNTNTDPGHCQSEKLNITRRTRTV